MQIWLYERLKFIEPLSMWRSTLPRDSLDIVASSSMRHPMTGSWPLLIGGPRFDGPFLGGILGRWCALRLPLISGSLVWPSWPSTALLGFWDSLVRDRSSQTTILWGPMTSLCYKGLQRHNKKIHFARPLLPTVLHQSAITDRLRLKTFGNVFPQI